MRERRETSAGFRRVSYHACAGVSLTTSDVFLTCDTTHRTGLRAKLQLKARVCCGEFFAKRKRSIQNMELFLDYPVINYGHIYKAIDRKSTFKR